MGVDILESLNLIHLYSRAGPRSIVSNMSDCRFVSDCRSRGPGQVPYFRGDHEIISSAIFFSSADSRRVVISYKGKYVHKVLVNCSVKLAQVK